MNSNYFFVNFVKLNRFIEHLFLPFKKTFSLVFQIIRKPFMLGYNTYKNNLILKFLNENKKDLNFKGCKSIDERIVEYNWLFQEFDKFKNSSDMRLLDAGSTLNQNFLLKRLNGFKIYIQTLYPEKYCEFYNNISYIYSDFADEVFSEEFFDIICCISVLEHVGFDNSKYKFFQKKLKNQDELTDNEKYINIVKYFKKTLKKNGILYITVPFGKYLKLKTLQQFDEKMIHKMIMEFEPKKYEIKYVKYENGDWLESDAKKCSECEIRNIDKINESNTIASAEAVALIKLIK